jgi:hypothetical protein
LAADDAGAKISINIKSIGPGDTIFAGILFLMISW